MWRLVFVPDNIYSPYPEEFNRQAVSIISAYNFAPTELSKENLLREGKNPDTIYVTGNTAIDALKTTVREDYTHPDLEWAKGSRLIIDHGPSPGELRRAYEAYVPCHPPGM